MPTRLRDNLNSAYLSAAHSLAPRQTRRRVVAYVESYDDIFFWRAVLARYENSERYFEVMLPSRDARLERGKKAALMQLMASGAGESLIACVDADYDYILQGATPTSQQVVSNPYVFHTYAYAIENYQCFAPSLHEVCVAATLNDHAIFPFERFLAAYSDAVFPLFVWNIMFYRDNRFGQLSIGDFNHVAEVARFPLYDWERAVANVRHKVKVRCQQLRHRYPKADAQWRATRDSMLALGITPQTTYLYIQGHHLMDNVVLPVVSRVCDALVRERQNEISEQSVHATQRRNELSSYSNSIGDVHFLLKKNLGGMLSEPFQRLTADLERVFVQQKSAEPQPSPVS